MSRVSAGLPTNPRARPTPSTSSRLGSREPSRYRDDDNHSVRSVPSHRPREGLPSGPRRSQSRPREAHEKRNRRNSITSDSTASSSGSSSFWERGSDRSTSTMTSQDSMEYREVDQEMPSKNERYAMDSAQPASKRYEASGTSVLTSLPDTGYYWGRVTEAASALSQGMSQAWNTGLTPLTNDQNHEEEESHLLKVMRAYHLSKARSPADLPEWLFNERERGKGGLLRSEPYGNVNQADANPTQSTQRRHGRDYQTERPIAPVHSGNKAPFPTNPSASIERPRPTDGVHRLKTLRNLQRNNTSGTRIGEGARRI